MSAVPPANGGQEWRLRELERRMRELEERGSRPSMILVGEVASLRREMAEFRQAVIGPEGHVPKLETKVTWMQRTMIGLLISLVVVLVAASASLIGNS